MIQICIDPDGTAEPYVFLIVSAQTGIQYFNQVGGYLTLQNSAEGFLIPLGGKDLKATIFDWFWKRFKGNCHNPATDWTATNITDLQTLIQAIPCWHCQAGEDTRCFLKLDESRMGVCVEAWIPVLSPYGPGILTLNNSD